MPRSMPFGVAMGQLVAALSLLLGACAGNQPHPPRLERLGAAEVEALLPQPPNALSLDEIVAMSGNGTPPAEIIRRIDAVHAHFRLSATRLLELHRQGVALTVLDHMVEGERGALFDALAADIARRERECGERAAREVRQCQLQVAPLFWPQPFGDCWPP
jgi:hypothetical protein